MIFAFLPGGRKGRERHGADHLQAPHRRPSLTTARLSSWCRRRCCWPTGAALFHPHAVYRAARVRLCTGHPAGGAAHLLQVFRHLHALSLRFHLERQTGGLTWRHRARHPLDRFADQLHALQHPADADRDRPGNRHPALQLRRGVRPHHPRGADLLHRIYGQGHNWRTALRRHANELDSAANARAIDNLINFETVKYFSNEEYEARRYDEQLENGPTRRSATRPRCRCSTSARRRSSRWR